MFEEKGAKWLNAVLWFVQSLLAVAFGMAGAMKVSMPVEQLAANGMTFVNDYSSMFVRFIGVSELLGAVGLILPSILRIKPILTPIAASGIAVIMVLAASYHIMHNEPFMPTIVFLVMAVFVAWGRFKGAAIESR